jgi:hypothetical protein
MHKKLWGVLFGSLAVLASTEVQANSYNNNGGAYCREYTGTIYVGGRPEQGYGTACLQPDGSWQVISGDNVGQFVAPTYIIQQPEPVVYYERPRNVYRTTYYRTRDVDTSIHVSIGDDNRRDRWRHGRKNRYRDRWEDRYGYDCDRWECPRIHRSGSTISWR